MKKLSLLLAFLLIASPAQAVYTWNPFTNNFDDTGPAAVATTPGGADTQVQYNDSGAFGGEAGLTYVEATDDLKITTAANGPHLLLDRGGAVNYTLGSATSFSYLLYDNDSAHEFGILRNADATTTSPTSSMATIWFGDTGHVGIGETGLSNAWVTLNSTDASIPVLLIDTAPSQTGDIFTIQQDTTATRMLGFDSGGTLDVVNLTDGVSVKAFDFIGNQRATAAAGDDAYISFGLNTDAGNHELGRMDWEATNVGSGTEESEFNFYVYSSGVITSSRLAITENGIDTNGAHFLNTDGSSDFNVNQAAGGDLTWSSENDTTALLLDSSLDSIVLDGAIDLGTVETFTDLDTTPDVSSGSYWETNTSAVTITDFDGSLIFAGQHIRVESKGAITYDCTASGITCGGSDLVTASGDVAYFTYDGTDWDMDNYRDFSSSPGSSTKTLADVATDSTNTIDQTFALDSGTLAIFEDNSGNDILTIDNDNKVASIGGTPEALNGLLIDTLTDQSSFWSLKFQNSGRGVEANGDWLGYRFFLKNSDNVQHEYLRYRVFADDVTAGSEDTTLEIKLYEAGTARSLLDASFAGGYNLNPDGRSMDFTYGAAGGTKMYLDWSDSSFSFGHADSTPDATVDITTATNRIQLLVSGGTGGQTEAIYQANNSGGTELWSVENSGLITTLVGIDAIGAVDFDIGSADVLDVTVVTDGGTVILDGNITQDAGTSLFMGGLLDATGAVDMDYGSADITDHTFFTDGGVVLVLNDNTNTVALSMSGDRIFHDTNSDGTKDAGEEFIDAAPNPKFYVWSASATLPLEAADSVAPILTEAGTSLDQYVAGFDDSADECRLVTFMIPSDVDTSGTATFSLTWYAATAAAGNVVWDARWHEVNEGENWDAALTTDAAAADAADTVQDEITETTWTETMANLGWTAGEVVNCQVCRDADNASDTLTGDGYMISFALEIPRT